MRGKRTTIKIMAILAVAAVFLSAMLVPMVAEGDSSAQAILFDKGDGNTYWVDADSSKTTIEEKISAAATAAGLTYSRTGVDVTIDGVTTATVGSQTTGWRYYEYESNAWVDKTASYDGSANVTNPVALGFYPVGYVPSETPEYKESWTQVRGNSTMDLQQKANLGPWFSILPKSV